MSPGLLGLTLEQRIEQIEALLGPQPWAPLHSFTIERVRETWITSVVMALEAGTAISIDDRVISHRTGSFGDLHTNYAEWGTAETITAQWVFAAGLKIGEGQILYFGNDVALQRASANVLALGTGDTIRSANYASNVRGWDIAADGTAEFNNVFVRGSVHGLVFVKNLIDTRAGTLVVGKSAGVLAADMDIPATGTWYMYILDPPTGGFLFENGDIARAKSLATGDCIHDTWMTLSARTDMGDGTQRYTCTYESGDKGMSPAFREGATVVDYGASGQGLLMMTADLNYAPYYDVLTHSGAPWTTLDVKARLGNLAGITDPALSPTGFGLYSDNVFLTGDLVCGGGDIRLLSDGIQLDIKDTDPGASLIKAVDFDGIDDYQQRTYTISGFDAGGKIGHYIDVEAASTTYTKAVVSVSARVHGGNVPSDLSLQTGAQATEGVILRSHRGTKIKVAPRRYTSSFSPNPILWMDPNGPAGWGDVAFEYHYPGEAYFRIFYDLSGDQDMFKVRADTGETWQESHEYLSEGADVYADGEGVMGLCRRLVNRMGIGTYTHHRGTGTGPPAGCSVATIPSTLWAAWYAGYCGWFYDTYYAQYPNHASLPAGLIVHSGDPIADSKYLTARILVTAQCEFGLWADNFDANRTYAVGDYIWMFQVYAYGNGAETLLYTRVATSACTGAGVGAAATFAAWVNHASSGPYGPFSPCGDPIIVRLIANYAGTTSRCYAYVGGEMGGYSGFGNAYLYDDAWPGTSVYGARRMGIFHRLQGFAWACWDWYYLTP